MKKIIKNTVISLNFKMFDLQGRLIDQNEEPMLYLHGGYDNIMPSLEAALEGCSVGDTVDVTMKPSEAFGEIDTSLIREEEVSLFPNDIDVGMLLQTKHPDGSQSRPFRITKIDAGIVTVDGNHPLAGIALRFEATVLDVRAATKEEIAHGHVHGAHGHAH
jgi:FKBP-type peptidyl-prolyl cis-trans isomerase SlyD